MLCQLVEQELYDKAYARMLTIQIALHEALFVYNC